MIASVATNNMIMSGVALRPGCVLPFLMLGRAADGSEPSLCLLMPRLPSPACSRPVTASSTGHPDDVRGAARSAPQRVPPLLRAALLGQPLEDTLKDMATRIESTDFAFFITATLIQRQTGGDLSEVLKNISGMVRIAASACRSTSRPTAEGRFTGYILVAFPAVMFCTATS
jgi:hypothetical protein